MNRVTHEETPPAGSSGQADDVGDDEVRARYAAIVESSDDAIVGKSLEGIVRSWNRGAERLFGYAADEMIGQPIRRIVPPERLGELEGILASIRRGERVEPFETERLRKDGARILVSITVSPIRDASGRVIGASKIARDVTERRQIEAERERLLASAERARAEAESANRTKDEFLAMLGHELRNPLHALRNAVAAARLDDRHRARSLEIARRQIDQLARLVDDLLDVARITRGEFVLHRAPVDLAEIVARAVEAHRDAVANRGVRLAVDLPPRAVRVDGDGNRLQQAIGNLLDNAVKYTPLDGEVHIAVRCERGEATVRIRDTGIGIEPAMLPRIFDLFTQARQDLDRPEGGLGIGLTVVRKLVELHGGRVAVRSDGLGKGAEFSIVLPSLVGPRAAASSRPRRPPLSGDRARVLVVEDNRDAAEGMSMLLQLFGNRVRVVHDGVAAIEAARAEPPDVILLDIGLPGVDGYEVARRIRDVPELRQVVLVALTGYGRDQDRREALAAGFDHHLAKPVDPDALGSLIARFREEGVVSRRANSP
jgi:PAS domain S-box-containing protein